MILEKASNSDWLSNTYLVADKPGGHAVLIDTGGPSDPILKKIEDSLDQDNYYGLEHLFKELKSCLEEPF